MKGLVVFLHRDVFTRCETILREAKAALVIGAAQAVVEIPLPAGPARQMAVSVFLAASETADGAGHGVVAGGP